MIQQIKFIKNNRELVYTYSDNFVCIKRNEIEYVDAIDPIDYIDERQYIETNNPLSPETIQDLVEYINRLKEGVNN